MSLRNWFLQFGIAGKLEKLCLAGHPNLLHETQQEVDLGGKCFRPAGWDECFPTIDPYHGSAVMGDLVGLEPHRIEIGGCIQQTWRTARFEAQRTFALQEENTLVVRFRAANHQSEPLEYLWASHALFSTVELLKMQAAGGLVLQDFRLDGSEAKLFHPNQGPVELAYDGYRVVLTTDQPWWGIWINRGGWPVGVSVPFCCLGVEATSTAGEHPDGDWLAPGGVFEGRVTLTIR